MSERAIHGPELDDSRFDVPGPLRTGITAFRSNIDDSVYFVGLTNHDNLDETMAFYVNATDAAELSAFFARIAAQAGR